MENNENQHEMITIYVLQKFSSDKLKFNSKKYLLTVINVTKAYF